MFSKVFIPYKSYWSSPFCKWQGSMQNADAVELLAATARKFLDQKGFDVNMFDSLVLGTTIPQPWWFYDGPNFATLMGNPNISGPRISQACATSTVCVNYASSGVELGDQDIVLIGATDRTSNGPNLIWPDTSAPGGKPYFESWMLDGFGWDPTAECSPTQTAENVAKEHGFTREESDAMAIARYNKYTDALKNDRKFQKRYMIPVDIKISRKKTITIEEDEGIIPCTEEGMAKLRTQPDCILTFGAQTHAADGNAGMIVTTKEKADELSADAAVTIQVLSYGFARTKKGHMPAAPVPAAEKALKKAGVSVAELSAVKTHNPFSVNDLAMAKLLKVDEKIFNNYGSSIVWGHPQGPTTMRLLVELIEELVVKGGGYGMLAGCAAGDSGAALIIKVN
jgi:acetyl-CoA acetyltransferase family protein